MVEELNSIHEIINVKGGHIRIPMKLCVNVSYEGESYIEKALVLKWQRQWSRFGAGRV